MSSNVASASAFGALGIDLYTTYLSVDGICRTECSYRLLLQSDNSILQHCRPTFWQTVWVIVFAQTLPWNTAVAQGSLQAFFGNVRRSFLCSVALSFRLLTLHKASMARKL